MKIELILGIALLMFMVGIVFFFLRDARIRKSHRSEENTTVGEDDNLLMSAVQLKGYDRQAIIQAHKTTYCIHNTGVSMDDRSIYPLEYDEIGV